MQNLRHVTGGWVPFVMLDCGGLSVKWCLDLMSSARQKDISFETMIAMAEQAPPGSDGLIFYPYMLGERRPDNTAARGGFFGITLNHRAHHFARAVMEGVALALGMNLMHFRNRDVDIGRVYCVGGGTRNSLLNQIKADVLKLPLYIADEPEATLKGAGLLGAFGLGFIDDIADVAQACCGYTTVIEPDKKSARLYERYQENFNRVYEYMLGFYQDQ
jgi:sugar (pentulose or hexulose) kinase